MKWTCQFVKKYFLVRTMEHARLTTVTLQDLALFARVLQVSQVQISTSCISTFCICHLCLSPLAIYYKFCVRHKFMIF